MALCAVVGHPDFLYLDPYWKQMINHSIRYGCYDGDLPADLSTEEWNEDQEGHLFSTVIQSVMLELFPHEFMK